MTIMGRFTLIPFIVFCEICFVTELNASPPIAAIGVMKRANSMSGFSGEVSQTNNATLRMKQPANTSMEDEQKYTSLLIDRLQESAVNGERKESESTATLDIAELTFRNTSRRFDSTNKTNEIDTTSSGLDDSNSDLTHSKGIEKRFDKAESTTTLHGVDMNKMGLGPEISQESSLQNDKDETTSTNSMYNVDTPVKRRKKLTIKNLFDYKLAPDGKFREPTVELRNPQFWLDVNMELETLVELEDESDMLSTVVQFSVVWMDTSFRWDLDAVSRANISLPDDAVWTPGIVVVNPQVAQDTARQVDVKSIVRFSHDGLATWLFTRNIDTKCEVDTTYYPFDTQTCHIQVRFDMDTALTVNLNHINFLGDNNNWNISFYSVETTKDRNTGHCMLDIRIDLDRKPLAIILNVILPIFTLVTLSPLVFMLPKEPGDRLGLSLTTLLAVSVYMTMVADTLPKTSDPIPVLTIVLFGWYMSNTCIVIMILVNAKVARLGGDRKPPLWIRKVTFLSAHLFQLKFFCRNSKPFTDEEKQMKPKQIQNGSTCTCKTISPPNNGKEITVDVMDPGDDEQSSSSTEYHVDLEDTHVSVTWRQVSTILDRWLVLTIYVFKFTILAVLIKMTMEKSVPERPVVECLAKGMRGGALMAPHVPISHLNDTSCTINVPHYQQTSEARLLICPSLNE